MSWSLKLLPERPSGKAPSPGDMWPADYMINGENKGYYIREFLSVQYRENFIKERSPLMVKLPDETEFCLDSAFNTVGSDVNGYHVTGTAPNVTVLENIRTKSGKLYRITNGTIEEQVDLSEEPTQKILMTQGGVP